MKMSSRAINDTLLIALEEERLDASVAIQFKDRMREMTGASSGRVILDLSRVGFMDSSGLGAVVAAMKQLGAGRKIELAGLNETVRKVFRLTRMDTVFRIHDTVEMATGMAARDSHAT